MKVMSTNKVTAVSMTDENSNFPAENMMDEHPRKYALSTASTTTITATIGAGVGGFALFNTNAMSAELTLKDNLGAILTTVEYDLSGITDYYSIMMDDTDPHYSLWFDYDTYYQPDIHTVEIALNTNNVAIEVYAGVIYAGNIRESDRGVQYGCRESLIDYSIVKELSNGSTYYRKRDVVKCFDCQILLNRSGRDFYNFMHSTCQAAGPTPMAWKLTDINDIDWTVYGRLTAMPQSSHDYPDDSVVSFSIVEEV